MLDCRSLMIVIVNGFSRDNCKWSKVAGPVHISRRKAWGRIHLYTNTTPALITICFIFRHGLITIPVLFVFKMVERVPNWETINFLFISSELVELHLSWFSKAGLDVSLFASIGHYLCPAPTCCSLIKVIRHLVASIDAEKHPFLLLSRVPREPLITCLNISACYDK
jgi:hypothetical protein